MANYISLFCLNSTGALIGGVIGGSLALGLVIITSLVAVLIMVLVCRRHAVPGRSVHLTVNVHVCTGMQSFRRNTHFV